MFICDIIRMAGNRLVFEVHGSVHRNFCVECGKEYDAQFIKNSTGIPRCTECGSCADVCPVGAPQGA